MEHRQPGKLESALAIASAIAMTWYMMPPSDRMLIRLRVTASARRAVARLAWREGHAGMRDELAGRDPRPRYGTAYALSRMRDGLGKALEAMRP